MWIKGRFDRHFFAIREDFLTGTKANHSGKQCGGVPPGPPHAIRRLQIKPETFREEDSPQTLLASVSSACVICVI